MKIKTFLLYCNFDKMERKRDNETISLWNLLPVFDVTPSHNSQLITEENYPFLRVSKSWHSLKGLFLLLDLVQNCGEKFGTRRIIYTRLHTWKDIHCLQNGSSIKTFETHLQSNINCRKKEKLNPQNHRATRNLGKSSSRLPIVHIRIKVYGFPEKNPRADEKDVQWSTLHDIPTYSTTHSSC